MKKHLFFLSFLFVSGAVMAQSKPSFGVRVGVVNSSMSGDAVNNFQNLLTYTGGAVTSHSKTGFYGGGFVSIPVSENFSVEPGLTYTQKGYELRGSLGIKGTDIIGGKSQLDLAYIEMPVLAKATISGLQLFAGPQVGYLASANLHTTAGVFGFNFINDKRDVKDQFNPWDVSLTGGVGYQFGNGFSINAAYDHGLSKVNSGQSIQAYNQAVKVGVGFRF
ncbi:porin family protein [Flavisolibacter nicotianae]|uniref:porin family protein n=1 Tax=Flavisolibacter nicotianae TaxID=2364882 RepID=UPI000EADC127|nr:porin family protein [Flavisolibacter nicotianae]